MKSQVVLFLALVALVAPTSITTKDPITLEENTAFGYLSKVGVPLATRIREAETQSNKTNKGKRQVRNAVGPSIKIVNGNAARLGDFPYQAGILIDISYGESVCGGSLLSANRVITAAHCWWDGVDKASQFTVVLGSVKLYTGGIRLKTCNVIIHNEWNPKNFRNDIAMAFLPKAVTFSNIIQPIALPSGYMLQESFTGKTVVTSGFGHTKDHDIINQATYLSYVSVQVISNSKCESAFYNVWPLNICTTGLNKKNICGGDSGGPLVIARKNKRFLIGITSFGSNRSCEDGYPAGFTRVTSFIGWIRNLL